MAKENEKNRTALVIATMSSGKSTLINALLGEDILLSKNEACTSNSYYIKKDTKFKDKLCIRSYDNEGLLKDEFIISIKEKELIKKHMDTINLDNKISKIELLSNFKKIKNLSLIDTPGTNNSLDFNHMKKTVDTIKNSEYDNIVYILNATQLGVNDDRELLECVKKYTHIKFREVIFVINKIDELDIEQDDSLTGIYDNCKKYLNSCGFEKPKIFMTSAYIARLIQKKQKKEYLTKREERKLNSIPELLSDSEFNLDEFNEGEATKTKSIFKSIRERKLKGTGILELRNYLTREEK